MFVVIMVIIAVVLSSSSKQFLHCSFIPSIILFKTVRQNNFVLVYLLVALDTDLNRHALKYVLTLLRGLCFPWLLIHVHHILLIS